MKIGITIPQLSNKGGVASYYNSILPYLKNMSNLQIICFNYGSKFGASFSMHPITDQYHFYKFIKLEQPDLIHVNPSLNLNSFIRDGLFIWQAKKKGIPVLVFFRGWNNSFEKKLSWNNSFEKKLSWNNSFKKKLNRILRFLFRKTYMKADRFIVLSSNFKYKLKELGIQSKISVGTTAVDNNLLVNFDINKKVSKIVNSETINILFLSRIEKEKGVFETIDAFDMLLDYGFRNIHLSIAGEGTSFYDMKYYIKNKRIPKDKISILGYVRGKNKTKAFTEHDLFCFPTYHGEGMPNSVLEAMAFGMAVITRPVGGIKDFFENGKMGFLSNGTSADEIFSLIVKLLRNKELLINISKYNHEYAQKYFVSSVVVKNLYHVYSSLI